MKKVLIEISSKSVGNQSLHIESSLINYYLNNFEWEQLTSEEKQKKRKRILSVLKKYKEEDGLETYHYYENALIKLYDIFLFLKKEIDSLKINNLLDRLEVLMFTIVRANFDKFINTVDKEQISTQVFRRIVLLITYHSR